MTPDEARALMREWTQSPALRVHMEAVGACMGHYARTLAPDEADRWIACGLLHDFDYEKHPSREEHPFVGVRELERLGVDGEIRTAIQVTPSTRASRARRRWPRPSSRSMSWRDSSSRV